MVVRAAEKWVHGMIGQGRAETTDATQTGPKRHARGVGGGLGGRGRASCGERAPLARDACHSRFESAVRLGSVWAGPPDLPMRDDRSPQCELSASERSRGGPGPAGRLVTARPLGDARFPPMLQIARLGRPDPHAAELEQAVRNRDVEAQPRAVILTNSASLIAPRFSAKVKGGSFSHKPALSRAALESSTNE